MKRRQEQVGILNLIYHLYTIISKEEMRAQVAEYKRQKDELNEYIELEQYLLQEVEQENKIKNTKQEISRFQSRVKLKI